MAERAGTIALQTHQRIAGVIENMSWLELPDGSRMELFGSGGGGAGRRRAHASRRAPVPLLGQVPLETALREGGDAGRAARARRPRLPGGEGAGGDRDRAWAGAPAGWPAAPSR